jgi:FkbM family methyltransferase
MEEIRKRVPGVIIETIISGKIIRFFVNNPSDIIQKEHHRGHFYEVEELTFMSGYMTSRTAYLDIGANIGNHIIWLNKFIGLTNIVVIEPHPLAIAILETNLLLNEMTNYVDLSYLGVGLSDRVGHASMVAYEDNLGSARFIDGSAGNIKLTTADKLLGNRNFDFVKIDTEGMELKCLSGMRSLLERCRPIMFIEVDNRNADEFREWAKQNVYIIERTFRRYQENENYLIVPAEKK